MTARPPPRAGPPGPARTPVAAARRRRCEDETAEVTRQRDTEEEIERRAAERTAALEAEVRRLTAEAERQKEVELALRESHARFARLFESELLGIVLSDVHGGVREANDAMLAMLSRTRSNTLRASRSRSRSAEAARGRGSSFATTASGSRRPMRSASSAASSARRRPGTTPASASGCTSPTRSSRRTAGPSPSAVRRAAARASSSRCRFRRRDLHGVARSAPACLARARRVTLTPCTARWRVSSPCPSRSP
jgi:hypothetical protein